MLQRTPNADGSVTHAMRFALAATATACAPNAGSVAPPFCPIRRVAQRGQHHRSDGRACADDTIPTVITEIPDAPAMDLRQSLEYTFVDTFQDISELELAGAIQRSG